MIGLLYLVCALGIAEPARPVPVSMVLPVSVETGVVPSTALQAELVAALHKYIGTYHRLVVPELSASRKELKVTGITLSSADESTVSVKFNVRIREIRSDVITDIVLYTLNGSARGKFQLGDVTSNQICIAAPPFSNSALTVTSLNIPHVSGPNETEAAKRALAANFPTNLCVPLYPGIAISNASGEECLKMQTKPAPVGNRLRFTVTLSNLSARVVSVHYATTNGTAVAGTDYTAVSGSLSIPSKSRSGTISVAVKCRQGEQGSRSFTLDLSSPQNCVFVDNQGQGLVIDYPFGVDGERRFDLPAKPAAENR